MNQARNNLKKVFRSVEMDCILADFYIPIIIFVVFGWVVGLSGAKPVQIIIVTTAVVISTIFALWRTIRVLRKPDAYIFCSAVLAQPHHSIWWRGTMYFTVVIEDAEGNRFPANTHDIFYTHSITGLSLEDYVNKTVEVGYNEETGQVVIIG